MSLPKNLFRDRIKYGGRGAGILHGGRDTPVHSQSRRPRVLLNACTATTGWAVASNCTITTASITNPEGVAQTLLKMTASGASVNSFWDYTWSHGLLNGKAGIEFDLYVKPATSSTSVGTGNSGPQIDLSFRDSGATNNLSCTFQATYGWQRVKLCKSDFSIVAAGSPAWNTTAFATLRWRIAGTTGITHEVHIRNLSFMSWDPPLICIIFDDIGISVLNTAYPIMAARGIVGTNAVISDAIGQSAWGGYDRMSVAQLRSLNEAGWSCTNHTKTHGAAPFLTGASQATCLTEISTCRNAIISNNLGDGIGENTFCAPYGEFAANYYAAYDEIGAMKLYRGTVVLNSTLSALAANSQCLLGTRLVPCLNIDRTYATSIATTAIDRTIERGGALILLYHHIVTSPSTSIERSTANFTTEMDYLQTKMNAGLITCVNLSQLYERLRL